MINKGVLIFSGLATGGVVVSAFKMAPATTMLASAVVAAGASCAMHSVRLPEKSVYRGLYLSGLVLGITLGIDYHIGERPSRYRNDSYRYP